MAADENGMRRHDGVRLAFGLAIIALGVLLLLDRVGTIEWAGRSGWWPLFLIAFGLARAAMSTSRGLGSGVFFALVGVWGLLNQYGVLDYDRSWPILLVIGGGSMIVGSFRRRPPVEPMPAAPDPNAIPDWRVRRRDRPSRDVRLLWTVIFL